MSIITGPKHASPVQRPRSARVDTHPDVEMATVERAKSRGWPKRTLLLIAALSTGGLLILYALTTIIGGITKPDSPLIYYTVKTGDLDITVVERGNLESQDNVEIYCEVDDIRGDDIEGTPILQIVPNGTSVKEGDLLVELDSASHLERLDMKILEVEQARALQIQTAAKYLDQESQNEKAMADAELAVKLAELDLKMFQDPKKGTHQLEVEEIERLIENVNNEILEPQASLELKRNDKQGIESLFKLGYSGKSERDRARLEFLQAESSYAAKINQLDTQLATRDKKITYEREKQELQLHGDLATAHREVQQVLVNNKAELEQADAAKKAAENALEKEEELLQRYREQLEKCKIYAPQDGMVAYATASRYSRGGTINEGAPVRERQHILSLPNLTKMQVKTSIHESVLDQVEIDMRTTIRLDAYPDSSYRGSVKTVAVLPDQGGWMSSDTKVYQTVVTIDEDVENLKPGMTAVVEIHVDRLEDVLSIPVQAIVQVKRDSWCYVDSAGKIERRLLKLGKSNDKFVQICEGLVEGEQIVLNPMAIVEAEQEDDSTATEDSDEASPETDQMADEGGTGGRNEEQRAKGEEQGGRNEEQRAKGEERGGRNEEQRAKGEEGRAKIEGQRAPRGEGRTNRTGGRTKVVGGTSVEG